MDKDAASGRIALLRNIIEYHNNRYYQQDNPEISDIEYDRLMRELQELEKLYPDDDLTSSPTSRVGAAPLAKFSSTEHPSPMLSHTVHMNHSKAFWALVSRHDPFWRTNNAEMRSAWKYVPAWVSPKS